MRNSHAPLLIRMFVLMVAAPNVDEYPSIILELGDDFAAVHIFIIHTMRIKSIPLLLRRRTEAFSLQRSGRRPVAPAQQTLRPGKNAPQGRQSRQSSLLSAPGHFGNVDDIQNVDVVHRRQEQRLGAVER